MKKPFTHQSKQFRVLFWSGIAVALFGLAIAVAGGVCIELTSEDTAWANAIFIAGMVVLLAGIPFMIAASVAERKAVLKRQTERERELPEDCFLIGDSLVRFQTEGIEIKREDELFEEDRITVPYGEAAVYLTLLRRSIRDKGRETAYLKLPARYFDADAGADAYVCGSSFDLMRLESALRKYSVSVTDTRRKPDRKPLLLKKFDMRKGRAKYVLLFLLAFIGVVAAGIGVTVLLAKNGIADAAGVVGGMIGGISAPVLLSFAGRVKGGYLRIYDAGFSFSAGGMHGGGTMFVPWEEVTALSRKCDEYGSFIVFDRGFSVEYFNDDERLWNYLRENFPEKVQECAS